jgi:hypothetical protein
LIDTHNRSRKNIIESEIDASITNKRWIRIKLRTIETIRMMSDDLGTRDRKISKRSESG